MGPAWTHKVWLIDSPVCAGTGSVVEPHLYDVLVLPIRVLPSKPAWSIGPDEELCARWQEVVILETEIAHKATQETLALHSIPSAVSKDLMDVLPPTTAVSQELLDVVSPAADAGSTAVATGAPESAALL